MFLILLALSILTIHIGNYGATGAITHPLSPPSTTPTGASSTPAVSYTTTQTQTTRTESCGSGSNVCRRGYDGPQGPQGLPGVQGIQGPRGTQGIEGCRGTPGRVGPQGSAGIPGVDGTTGAQGVVGLKGDKGDPGTCTCEVEMAPAPSSRQAASYVNPAQTYNAPRPPPSTFHSARGSAFSVARVTPILPHQTNKTAITFDLVHANLGKDFDINTGMYTCPLNGTYYFSTHVYKHKITKKPSIRMYKNDEYIMVIDDFAPPNTHDSTSSSVILSLAKGDRVWLDLSRKVKMHHNLWRRTIFSGFLLFPEEAGVADP